MTGVMQKASIVSGGCYCSLWDSSRLERPMFFRGPGRRYNKGASFGGIKWYEAGISGDVCLSDRAEVWIMLNLAFDHSWIGGTVVLNCPKCGKEIRDEGFAFCPHCGAQLETTASSPSRIGSTFLRTASNIAVILGAMFVVDAVFASFFYKTLDFGTFKYADYALADFVGPLSVIAVVCVVASLILSSLSKRKRAQ